MPPTKFTVLVKSKLWLVSPELGFRRGLRGIHGSSPASPMGLNPAQRCLSPEGLLISSGGFFSLSVMLLEEDSESQME